MESPQPLHKPKEISERRWTTSKFIVVLFLTYGRVEIPRAQYERGGLRLCSVNVIQHQVGHTASGLPGNTILKAM
jgi:hypothetical protein